MACRLAGAKPLSEPMLEYFLIGPIRTSFSEISIEIYIFSFKKMHLKMSSGNCWLFCLCLLCVESNIFSGFWHMGLYSLNGKTSYRQISWSLKAMRLGDIIIISLWNLTDISAALLPRCLLNFRAIGKVRTRISRLRDFTRSCGKTSYCLVNRGPGWDCLSVMSPRRCLHCSELSACVCHGLIPISCSFISMG